MEGMLDLVEKLKRRNHTLILLSNTCEAHFDYLEQCFPIFKYFDNKVFSYKVGLRKPDPKIFLHSLKMVENNTNFCTDDLEENILSARKTGLDAVTFKNVDQVTSELTTRNFLS